MFLKHCYIGAPNGKDLTCHLKGVVINPLSLLNLLQMVKTPHSIFVRFKELWLSLWHLGAIQHKVVVVP